MKNPCKILFKVAVLKQQFNGNVPLQSNEKYHLLLFQ